MGRRRLELPAGVRSGRALRPVSSPRRRTRSWGSRAGVLGVALLLAAGGAARADEIIAVYKAYWAGLPAAEIRLKLRDGDGTYNDEIEIRTEGLPRLVTRFRGTAQAFGRLTPSQPAEPSRYDALYDLRKRRDSHISMRFVAREDAAVAERGSRDTSRKPPLAEAFRRNTVDPVTALERLRAAVSAREGAPGGRFSIPVYDGARRFDVVGRVLPKGEQTAGALRVELTLRPIAGFKGESSDDGDPDDAPRPVALTLTDDARLLPMSMTVRIFFLPLVVRLDHLCAASASCLGQAIAPQHAAQPPIAAAAAVRP
jgi:Protein of unknown function (DUF3108)